LNLQGPAEPYTACPYCLTKITEAKIEPAKKPERMHTETDLAKEKPSNNKEKLPINNEKSPGCQNHLGYLSERGQNQQIPDECIVCREIVECMLQKMRT